MLGQNTNIVGWIALAAYLQDSKKYYASLTPWLILGGLALAMDYLDARTCAARSANALGDAVPFATPLYSVTSGAVS